MSRAEFPIGIFDSGVGGISVLREAVSLLPNERFLYYGDNKNAPYGVQNEARIQQLALNATDHLTRQGIKALVVACNTATSAAIDVIRGRLQMPVVGMEPALKPAAQHYEGRGKILVLATPATLSLKKFERLMQQYGKNAIKVPAPGLMEFAERGETEGEALDAFLGDLLMPYRGEFITAVVLGCTHYVFLKKAIGKAIPTAELVDGNLGTVFRLRDLLAEERLLRQSSPGEVCFQSSGDEAFWLPQMQRLFKMKF